jgi:hypothetical protein
LQYSESNSTLAKDGIDAVWMAMSESLRNAKANLLEADLA